MKDKIKLFYSDEGQLLYSRHWPDVPEVQARYTDDLTIDLETGKLIRWNGQIYEPVELRKNEP